MKIATKNPFWIGKKIAFGGGVGELEFDKNGITEIEDAHFEYLKQHGLEEKTANTELFSIENCTPEQRKAIFLKLDLPQLQEETRKLAELLGKPDHEWLHLRLHSLSAYLVKLWDEIDELSAEAEVEKSEEKSKRPRKQKENE